MPLYRCTRFEPYKHFYLARDDKENQNYFIVATNPGDALEQMKCRYPGENRFSIELWSETNPETPEVGDSDLS
ncbi:MAG: hypothetical protein NVSMB70_20060 [Chamaesiphon sp.]